MAYSNLTAAQASELALRMHGMVDATKEVQLMECFNLIAGIATGDAAGLAAAKTAINAYTTTLTTKMNADAGITDTNYAPSALT